MIKEFPWNSNICWNKKKNAKKYINKTIINVKWKNDEMLLA